MNHNTTESESDGNDNMHQQQQEQEQQLQRHEENDHVTTMTPIININEGNNNTNDSNSNHNNNSYYASIYNHNNDDQTSSPPTTTIGTGTGTGITTTTTTLPTLPTTLTNTDLQFVVWNDALHTTCIQNNTLFVTPTQVVQAMYPHHIQDIPTIVPYNTNTEEGNDTDDKINTNRHYIQWNTLATSDNCTSSTMNHIDNSIELTTSSNHSQQQQQQQQTQKQKYQYELVKKIVHQRLIQEYNANMAIPLSETTATTSSNSETTRTSSSSSNIVSNVLYQSIVPFKLMYSSMKYIANTAVSATTSSNYNALLSSSDDYCPPSNYTNKTTTTTNDDDDNQNTSILQTILSPHNMISNKNIYSDDYDITPLKQQNKIKSLPQPIKSSTTAVTTKWDQLYLSIDIMMDCILYIQQQLQLRQQQYLTKQQIIDESNDNNDDDTTTSTIISTIVPVHMIRQEWFQPQQEHDHEQHQQQNNRIAKLVSETLSDQQFHFLLSILVRPSNIDSSNTANNNNRTGSVNESIYLLQRINRELHLGDSVYILQLPTIINNSSTKSSLSTIDNVNDDVRLTLYDINQSMKIIQKNIIQWRNVIEKDVHPSIVSSRHINLTNKQKVQQIHRQRMYEQHIDNAEATLLNLESVQMSILHTIHVSNPTISILQQAKDVIKTLRPSSSLTISTIESLRQDLNDDDDELQNDLDNLTRLDFDTISYDTSNNNNSESDTYCAIQNDSKSNSNNISKKEKTTTTTTTTTSTSIEVDMSDTEIVNLELRLQNLSMDIDQTNNLKSLSKTKQQQNKNMIISS